MIPILYGSNEQTFTNNGIGPLTDALSCIIVEERNGAFTLQMVYPVNGKHFADIGSRKIILAKPNNTDQPQPFRIYRITKPMSGKITVYAEHISYDLNGIPVNPFTAADAEEAIEALNDETAVTSPFIFDTDVETESEMNLAAPAAIRGILFDKEGSIVDHYGGEWKFNRFSAYLYDERGADNGMQIRYGKNLTTLEQDDNISNVYTGVLPYYYSENAGEAHGSIQNVPGTFDYTRILPLDLTDKFETLPTAAQLEAEARVYISKNDIGKPKVSLSLSFVELSKAAGFEHLALLETVNLCDTVTVYFEQLGIEQTAKVIKTEYDVLLERYSTISIGSVKRSVADTIAKNSEAATQAPSKDFMQKAIAFATDLITGNKGGYVVFHKSEGSEYPDEILIMDTPNINTAVNVWRWNQNGLGFSDSGYEGPYGTAITMDGGIVGNYLKVNTVEANRIVNHSIDDTQIRSGGISGGSGSGSSGGSIAPYSIGNINMGSGSIAYGNTLFTGTLDQVGVNAANISAMNGYFNGSVVAANIRTSAFSTGSMYFGGNSIRLKLISEGGTCLGT